MHRTIERRRFAEPDLVRTFSRGSGAVARVGAPAVERAELEFGRLGFEPVGPRQHKGQALPEELCRLVP
jgi:hypothetical protein